MKILSKNSLLNKVLEENRKLIKNEDDKRRAIDLFTYLNNLQKEYNHYVYFWEILQILMNRNQFSRALYFMETKLQRADYAILGLRIKPSKRADEFEINWNISNWDIKLRARYPSKYTLKENIISEIKDKIYNHFKAKTRKLESEISSLKEEIKEIENLNEWEEFKSIFNKKTLIEKEIKKKDVQIKIDGIKIEIEKLELNYKNEIEKLKKY